ncbi:mCG146325, partial [Mus musculus]
DVIRLSYMLSVYPTHVINVMQHRDHRQRSSYSPSTVVLWKNFSGHRPADSTSPASRQHTRGVPLQICEQSAMRRSSHF